MLRGFREREKVDEDCVLMSMVLDLKKNGRFEQEKGKGDLNH